MATRVTTSDDLLEVTLTLDTSAYATGDVLADTQEITGAFRAENPRAILQSIALIDDDDQAGALELVFLRSNVSLGTENAAVSITDANADEILTIVPIAVADYFDLVGSQFASKKAGDTGMGVLLEPASGESLWIGAISRDSKTYTASGITIKVGLLRS